MHHGITMNSLNIHFYGLATLEILILAMNTVIRNPIDASRFHDEQLK